MNITKLTLNNFRNYHLQHIDLINGVNVIFGDNAQGKTNLIEAIYLASIGKSLRTNRENDMISFDKESCSILLDYNTLAGSKNIEIRLNSKGKKIIAINHISILRIGELFGQLPSIFFSPDELKLIKETPQDRRKFLDIDLSQISKNYFYHLSRYNKCLDERNKLLKTESNKEEVKRTIFIWNAELLKTGSYIVYSRQKFIELLLPIAKNIHLYLTDNKEVLDLSYVGLSGENVDKISEIYEQELEKSFEKDFKLGFTNIGPHRDDIKILVNDVDIRNYGSQGQQRTVALSLKLAELEIFKNIFNEYPVLLLDDVMSELDENRRQNLLNYVKNIQTIITSTDIIDIEGVNNIQIKNGKVIK